MDDDLDRSVTYAAHAAWRRVLGIDDIAPDDDFFELGGHSLNAVRAVKMVSRDIGADVGVKVLLTNPEFREFVRAVTDGLAGTPTPGPIPTTQESE